MVLLTSCECTGVCMCCNDWHTCLCLHVNMLYLGAMPSVARKSHRLQNRRRATSPTLTHIISACTCAHSYTFLYVWALAACNYSKLWFLWWQMKRTHSFVPPPPLERDLAIKPSFLQHCDASGAFSDSVTHKLVGFSCLPPVLYDTLQDRTNGTMTRIIDKKRPH